MKKNNFYRFSGLLLALFIGFSFSNPASAIDLSNPKFKDPVLKTQPVQNNLKRNLRRNLRKNLKLPVRQCADPALISLSVDRPVKISSSNYDFLVRAVIKNVGTTRFDSANRQAGILFTQGHVQKRYDIMGGRRVVINPGQSQVVLHFVRGWNPSSEFLVPVTAQIIYDPDIYLDKNKLNDDCNKRNNKRTLSITNINRVLARTR